MRPARRLALLPARLLPLLLAACAAPAADPAVAARETVAALERALSRPPHALVVELPAAAAPLGTLSRARLDAAAARIALAPDGGAFTSRAVAAPAPFDELLLSWNVDDPGGAGFVVEVQVARDGGEWSPWLHIGDWNLPAAPAGARTEFAGGRVEVDVFRSDLRWDRARYRVRAVGPPAAPELAIARVTLCFSDTGRIAPPAAPPRAAVAVAVPPRRQGAEAPELAPRICSPTSLAMVLAARGVDRPTAEVAARVHDPTHDLYGNWPRAVQTAWSYGVPGFLLRVSSWDVVEALLLGGTPLIVSVRAEEGELPGAPYARTAGHLLVVRGLDAAGGVLVSDPAAPTLETVERVYARADLERVWMGIGGVTYVIGR